MDQILSLYLPLFLGAVTIVFVVASLRVLKATSKQTRGFESINIGVQQSRDAIANVGLDVQKIDDRLLHVIAPQLESVYHAVADDNEKLNGENLGRLLRSMGFEKFAFLDESHSIIFFGVEAPDASIKISVFLMISHDSSVLEVQSFSNYVENPSVKFLSVLLKANADTVIGKFGLKELKGKSIVMLNQSFLFQNGRFHSPSLRDAIQLVIGSHSSYASLLKTNELNATQIMIEDFVSLLQPPQEK